MTTGKTIALNRWTFVGKVMSLLFTMLSRFVIDFLFPKEQVSFNFMAAITICSDFGAQENKRHLLLGRKAMTNLDSISKSRDITLLTKVYLVKDMIFPVVMHGCESWITKKAEH